MARINTVSEKHVLLSVLRLEHVVLILSRPVLKLMISTALVSYST